MAWGNLLLGEKEINNTVLDNLETALITTDVGVETTRDIIEKSDTARAAP